MSKKNVALGVAQEKAAKQISEMFSEVTAGEGESDLKRYRSFKEVLEEGANRLSLLDGDRRSIVAEQLSKAVSGFSGQYNGAARYVVSISTAWRGLLEDSDVQRIVDRFGVVCKEETEAGKMNQFQDIISQEARFIGALENDERGRVFSAMRKAIETLPDRGAFKGRARIVIDKNPVWKEGLASSGAAVEQKNGSAAQPATLGLAE